MTFEQYQWEAAKTAIYPQAGTGSWDAIDYCLLGLGGEIGELLQKRKKIIRDGVHGDDRDKLCSELGDVLWYVAMLCKELQSLTLTGIAMGNLEKLRDRQQRGTLQGSGDNR